MSDSHDDMIDFAGDIVVSDMYIADFCSDITDSSTDMTPESSAKVVFYKEIALINGNPAIINANPLISAASLKSKAAMLPSVEGTAASCAAHNVTSSCVSCGTKGDRLATHLSTSGFRYEIPV